MFFPHPLGPSRLAVLPANPPKNLRFLMTANTLSVPPISADDSRVYTDQLQDIEARDEAAED